MTPKLKIGIVALQTLSAAFIYLLVLDFIEGTPVFDLVRRYAAALVAGFGGACATQIVALRAERRTKGNGP